MRRDSLARTTNAPLLMHCSEQPSVQLSKYSSISLIFLNRRHWIAGPEKLTDITGTGSHVSVTGARVCEEFAMVAFTGNR